MKWNVVAKPILELKFKNKIHKFCCLCQKHIPVFDTKVLTNHKEAHVDITYFKIRNFPTEEPSGALIHLLARYFGTFTSQTSCFAPAKSIIESFLSSIKLIN